MKVVRVFSILVCLVLMSAMLQADVLQPVQKTGVLSPSVAQKIENAVNNADYSYLGLVLKQNIKNIDQVAQLRKLGIKLKATKLLRAIRFTLGFELIKGTLQTKPGDLLQIALFMENNLSHYIKKGTHYLPVSATDLAYPIEYDPVTKGRFIILNNVQRALIGIGCRKKVFKCIFYSTNRPELLARAEQSLIKIREWRISQNLMGVRGLFATRALTQHSENGVNYSTIYSEIYRPGALKIIMKREVGLTVREKMKIAVDILVGLDSLHRRHIVHRDLGIENYFVNMSAGKPDVRTIKAVIADFGHAMTTKRAVHVPAQAYVYNVAPEGLYYTTMSGAQYYRTDVFALGSALYRLFYGVAAPWQKKNYLDTSHSVDDNYREFIAKINQVILPKHGILTKKKAATKLTAIESFELLILQMVHSDPAKRGTASELKKRMQRIYRNYLDKELSFDKKQKINK